MRAPTLKQVDKHLQQATTEIEHFACRVCDKQLLSALCLTLCRICQPKSRPLPSAGIHALYQSLEHLIDKPLDDHLVKLNMHRIVANWHFIEEGMRIPEWGGESITAHVVFIGVLKLRYSSGGRERYLVELKLKTGLGAGIITHVSLYAAAIYRFLEKFSGTRSYDCPAEELAGMEARVVLSVAGHQATIHEWDCTTAQREHNKTLSEFRIGVSKCANPIPCNVCKKTIEQCPLAVWLPQQPKETE